MRAQTTETEQAEQDARDALAAFDMRRCERECTISYQDHHMLLSCSN